jgi:hypothetical protein
MILVRYKKVFQEDKKDSQKLCLKNEAKHFAFKVTKRY